MASLSVEKGLMLGQSSEPGLEHPCCFNDTKEIFLCEKSRVFQSDGRTGLWVIETEDSLHCVITLEKLFHGESPLPPLLPNIP